MLLLIRLKLKKKVTGETGNGTKNIEIMIPLKNLSFKVLNNFWRTLEMPLTKCEFNRDVN